MLIINHFSVPFQPTGTNVVTNTAPTPGVRMRVVRRLGANTADVVGLGEDLQLRIEIDQVSRGGKHGQSKEVLQNTMFGEGAFFLILVESNGNNNDTLGLCVRAVRTQPGSQD